METPVKTHFTWHEPLEGEKKVLPGHDDMAPMEISCIESPCNSDSRDYTFLLKPRPKYGLTFTKVTVRALKELDPQHDVNVDFDSWPNLCETSHFYIMDDKVQLTLEVTAEWEGSSYESACEIVTFCFETSANVLPLKFDSPDLRIFGHDCYKVKSRAQQSISQ